jgi:subtilase family serine protease
MRILVRASSLLAAVLLLGGWAIAARAPVLASRAPQPIDEGQAVTLAGNVHPLARGEFEQGVVAAETRLNRMVLALAPTPAQQAALDALVAAQHRPGSPLYHHWLTPAEYGARFGASAQDVARVAAWLAGHGFTVEEIPAGRRLVIFSGTAGQVFDAFHTEMRRYRVAGVDHIANAQDPQIPSSLAAVVAGVVSLNDFRSVSAIASRRPLGGQAAGGPRPLYSAGSTHYLFPADFAAIYDLNPLYSAGTSGSGTAIAIVGRSNIKVGDVAAFRAQSALAANQPTVILAGADPGLVAGDQDESTLDVEWAGAVAPAAAVKLVVGESTGMTDGVDLAAAYAVNHASAPVVSVSYGNCEQAMGTAEMAFYNSLWEQAASQGMSAFVASGDAGAAGCSAASDPAGSFAAVNGMCSSPYSTCVGGTEFNEGSNPAQFWSSTNGAGDGSGLGYLPEEGCNESALTGGTGLWGSGGGASAVYAQPQWQAGVSGAGAANGMRAVPDVALSAASHDGYTLYENGSYWVASGTSAASPSFAGLMALVVETQGGTGQGSANPALYALLNAAHNPFHATPSGSNSVPGVAGFTASGASYNLATGLGSADGAVLVSSWGSGTQSPPPPPTLTLTAAMNSLALIAGSSGAVSFTAATGGSFSGNISFTVSGLPPGVTAAWSTDSITPAASVSVATTTLTLTASALVKSWSAGIAVTATGDGLAATRTLAVQVQARQACDSLLLTYRSRCNEPVRTPVLRR